MNTALRTTIGLTGAALLVLLSTVPAVAQEDESGGDDEGWGKILVDIGAWAPKAGGFGDQIASIGNPLSGSTRGVGFAHPIEIETDLRIGAELARNVGRITYSRFVLAERATLELRDPGNFIYGESLAFPLFAGLANDGLADAVNAGQRTELRDQRVEYSRMAFSNSRVRGRWTVGFRSVDYMRNVDATYYALVPTFPAFLPPLTGALPGLVPIADTAVLGSVFEGGGLSGGMEFQAPLATDKLLLEAKVNIAILVGDVRSDYTATNGFYTLMGVVLEAPYSELADYTVGAGGVLTGTATSVSQQTITVAAGTDSSSVTSQVYELSLGARWSAVSFMDVFLGYRTTHYGNVITEIRPVNIIVTGSSTINATSTSRTDRSVTYKGFYGGVGFRF